MMTAFNQRLIDVQKVALEGGPKLRIPGLFALLYGYT